MWQPCILLGKNRGDVFEIVGFIKVVFDLLKESRILYVKFDKVNMAKYHQAVTSGSKHLKHFGIKGFFLGIACNALGYKMKAAPLSSAIAEPELVPDTASSSTTLAQEAHAQAIKLGNKMNHVNQLHRACSNYNNPSNYHKQCMISKTLTHLAKVQGCQNAKLRDLDSTIPWETTWMKGAMYEHTRLAMMTLNHTQWYEEFGIEMNWSAIDSISLNHPRVVYSNDFAETLWESPPFL